MFNRGYYGYKAEGIDVKTRFYVEYTADRKVFDLMETSKFDFEMLNKKEFDFLEDAVSFFNYLYYDERILHVMLFEEVLLNGEVILEQCKDMVLPSALDEISRKRVKQAEEEMELYKMENEKMKKFLARHGIDYKKNQGGIVAWEK